MYTLQIMANTIRHQGFIESMNGSHIKVRIIQVSACASCSIKGHCTSADVDEKLIDVETDHPEDYKIGDKVWVVGALSMGMTAVFLAFVLPLVLLVFIMFLTMHIQQNELVAVAASAVCLAVYYFILWLNKSRLGKKFSFSILPEKINL